MMTAQKVQSIMRTKHIVVTDMPSKNVRFNSEGLQTLTNLDAKISIQGATFLFDFIMNLNRYRSIH